MSVNLKTLKAKRDRVNELRVLAACASEKNVALIEARKTSYAAMEEAFRVFNEEFAELEQMGRDFAVDDGEGDHTPKMVFEPEQIVDSAGQPAVVKTTASGVKYINTPNNRTSRCGDENCPQHSASVIEARWKKTHLKTKKVKKKKYVVPNEDYDGQ